MKCPVCKNTVLADHQLLDGPPSHLCSQCGGQWVEAARYWTWLQDRGNSSPSNGLDDAHPPLVDSLKAKLCPECGRILTRAKVGRGADFWLERCSHCGGIWFDPGEWESLRALNLHDDVHFVFSSAWQAEIARVQRQREHDLLLKEKLGETDFAEIQRVKVWIDSHPHRAELQAVLLADAASAKRRGTGAEDANAPGV